MPAVTVTMIILGSLAAIILTTVYFSGGNVLILCARNNVLMSLVFLTILFNFFLSISWSIHFPHGAHTSDSSALVTHDLQVKHSANTSDKINVDLYYEVSYIS